MSRGNLVQLAREVEEGVDRVRWLLVGMNMIGRVCDSDFDVDGPLEFAEALSHKARDLRDGVEREVVE